MRINVGEIRNIIREALDDNITQLSTGANLKSQYEEYVNAINDAIDAYRNIREIFENRGKFVDDMKDDELLEKIRDNQMLRFDVTS